MLRSVVVSEISMYFFVLGSIVISGTLGKTNFQGDFQFLPSSEQRVSTEQVISRMLSILMTMNEPPFLLLAEKLKQDSTIQAFLHTSQNDILKGNPSAETTELLREKREAILDEEEEEQCSTSNVKEEIETLKTTTQSQSLTLNEIKINLNEVWKVLFQLKTLVSSLPEIFDGSANNSTQKKVDTVPFVNKSQLLFSGTNSLNNLVVGQFVSDILRHDTSSQEATYTSIWKSDQSGEFQDGFKSFTQSDVTWRNWIETSVGERVFLQVRNLDLKAGDSLRIYDPFNTTNFLIAELNGKVAHFNINSVSYILLMDVVHGHSSGKRNYDIRFDTLNVSVPVVYSVTKSIFQRYISQIMERDCHFLRYSKCTILEADEGSITPPRVKGRYRNDESQAWLIKSRSGKRISLNVMQINSWFPLINSSL